MLALFYTRFSDLKRGGRFFCHWNFALECTEGSAANASSKRSYGPDAADRTDFEVGVVWIHINM